MVGRGGDSGLAEIASRSPEIEAERAVLGGVLVDPTRFDDAAELLTDEDWFRHAHRLIWSAMRRVVAGGGALDYLTLKAAMTDGELDTIGGPVYIFGLTDGVPRASNVGHYARLVRDYAIRRSIESLGRSLVAAAASGDESGAELLERSESTLAGLRTAQPGTELGLPADGASEVFRAIEAAADGKRRGVLSGLRELDAMTFGFRPGQLIVLGARPSQGKTALALNLAVAAEAAGPVLFASLEMSSVQIRLRELALRSEIPHALLDAGRVSSHLAPKMTDATQAIHDGSLYLFDKPGATVSQIRAAVRRLLASAKRTPSLVVVDYLQLMRSERGARVENRTLEVAQFSAGLKMIAREMDVPVLALSQLSRQSETRQDKRPMLADLRESGSLEQDADIVLLLHRPGVYDRSTNDPRAEVIVAKQRNGPTGIAHLRFNADTMAFADGVGMSAYA